MFKATKNRGLLQQNSQKRWLPSGKLTVCYWKYGPVEIVDLPIYKTVDLSSSLFVNVETRPGTLQENQTWQENPPLKDVDLQ